MIGKAPLRADNDTPKVDPDPLPFLHPHLEPDTSGYLDVGDGHTIWWEASGSPSGIPVVLLHGGPGAPPKPLHRRFFDPAAYRLTVLHQRGCGKSRPLARVQGNTTGALIGDLELLRAHLGISRWLVVGGSWGSILALAYGERHPEACLGFGLMGVSLGRARDIDWWWNGTAQLFPEAYAALVEALPEELRADPKIGYLKLLNDHNPAVHLPAAKALCLFSGATVAVDPSPETLASYDDPDTTLPLARLFLNYCTSLNFLRPGQLLDELPRIAHLPCGIVAARRDVTTPPESAWLLHKAWPGSTLDLVPDAAHSLATPSHAKAFMDMIDSLRARL